MDTRDRIPEPSWAHAAWVLDCEVAAIKAVAKVESAGRPFLATGEPVVLFERHVFHRLTGGKWSAAHPDISSPAPGGYGPASRQHERLARAAALDRESALMSASYGAFQILAINWRRAGAASLQDFINRMYRSADEHLRAFVLFVLSDPQLAVALRDRDWGTFARRYNGPAHDRYDQKMAAAYAAVAEMA